MLNLAIKSVAQLLSSKGEDSRLCVLTFHRVLPKFDPLRPNEPTVETFDANLKVFKDAFNVLRLDHAVASMREKRLPPRALAICFDDGYRDNFEIALPILKRHNAPATFFVATSFLNGGAMFNDIVIEAVRDTALASVVIPWVSEQPLDLGSIEAKRAAIGKILPVLKKQPLDVRSENVAKLNALLGTKAVENLMMSPEQVRGLHRAGMEIGGHTVKHPILLSLSDHDASKEISQGRAELESILGESIAGFAYPNGRPGGDYDDRHAKMVEGQGFSYAVSTRWATCTKDSDRFQLPRVAPWGSSAVEFGLRTALAYRDR